MSERLAIQIFSLYPPESMAYHHDQRVFHVGDKTVPLQEIGSYFPELDRTLTHEEAATLMAVNPVLIQHGENLFQMPVLQRWLSDITRNQYHALQKLITRTMTEVYVETGGDRQNAKAQGNSFGEFYFGFDEERPVFQVAGNCVCARINPDRGTVFERLDILNGYGEFVLHNTEQTYENYAILAGIGTLALACSSEVAGRYS